MSVLAVFTPETLTADQYAEVNRRLDQTGQNTPKGRLDHICSVTEGGKFQVMELWESMEALQQYGQILMPVLQQVGIVTAPPQISQVHNRVAG